MLSLQAGERPAVVDIVEAGFENADHAKRHAGEMRTHGGKLALRADHVHDTMEQHAGTLSQPRAHDDSWQPSRLPQASKGAFLQDAEQDIGRSLNGNAFQVGARRTAWGPVSSTVP